MYTDTGCPKKTQNYWNNVLLEFECPTHEAERKDA
jgi:hypothetical protein